MKMTRCAAIMFFGVLVMAGLASCQKATEEKAGGPAEKKTEAKPEAKQAIKVGVMPKLVGIDYFNAVEKGAKEAAQALGVELTYDGPVTNDVTKQAAIVETWIARHFDVICVAPNDPASIAPVLEKARMRGIKVITFDADSKPKARDFFINQATYDDIAKTLVETMAKAIGPEGKFLILTGSLTAVNQNIWMDRMEKYRAEHYPNMKNLSPTPKTSEEDQAKATQVTIDVLKTYPDLQGMYALTSVALPGAAEGLVKENAFNRVFLTGLSTPKTMREYVKQGAVKEFILWNPVDLGYLTVTRRQAAGRRQADAPEHGDRGRPARQKGSQETGKSCLARRWFSTRITSRRSTSNWRS